MNKPITLCDRCDIVMHCLLDYDGIPCRKNRTVEPTNADRIRAMSDEKLADYFSELSCFPGANRDICRGAANCEVCWLSWLKSPVEDTADGR